VRPVATHHRHGPRWSAVERVARSSASGEFEVEGLRAGECEVIVHATANPRVVVAHERVVVPASGVAFVPIALASGEVHGEVTAAASPADRLDGTARLRYRSGDRSPGDTERFADPALSAPVRSGRFVFEDAPAGPALLELAVAGHTLERRIDVPPQGTLRLALTLEPEAGTVR